MADEKHLAILKQGVVEWNRWREEKGIEHPNLSEIDLRGIDLSGANLSGVDLSGANLHEVDLFEANLFGAIFWNTDLRGATLVGADLFGADFSQANLRNAKCNLAALTDANLDQVNLNYADFSKANFTRTELRAVDVCGTVFKETHFSGTKIIDTDLSLAIQTEVTIHAGPSNIDTDTLRKSKGRIPEKFLRGCGLNDIEVAFARLYDPDLSNDEITTILYRIHDLRVSRPVQLSPIFISYSRADASFVDQLEIKLTEYGIRFWRDIHDATSGRMEKQVDRAIRNNPTVLLILSEHSTESDWVEWEVTKAQELEKDLGRDVLCPIALDDSWKTSKWPGRIMNQVKDYNIMDFSEWGSEAVFEAMFIRLLKGLELYYKK